MPSLPADASHTLDVRPGGRCRLILLQRCQQMLCELGEDVSTAGQDQVPQGNDGPFTYCQPGAGQLRQQAGQDGGME